MPFVSTISLCGSRLGVTDHTTYGQIACSQSRFVSSVYLLVAAVKLVAIDDALEIVGMGPFQTRVMLITALIVS